MRPHPHMLLSLITLCALTACPASEETPRADMGTTADMHTASDMAVSQDMPASQDMGRAEDMPVSQDMGAEDMGSGGPVYLGDMCEAGKLERGNTAGPAECVMTQPLDGDAGNVALIRANCTDEAITALLDKQHLVMVPRTPSRAELWVHFGGSGGQPTNNENIGMAALKEGYRYISLAYPNEPSVSDRCTCPGGSRPAECEGLVRGEVLYGRDLTPWFEMEADEAIVPRLVALLRYLHMRQPSGGWDAYLDANGAPVWSKIAVSGFSQGGGMAGLIARDHKVARALYFSKGAGGVSSAMLSGVAAPTCTADAECEVGRCCLPHEVECAAPPAQGGRCIYPVPAPWAMQGADTDGDGVGEGGPEARATPASRQFAIVHREESAWQYSPEVFATWGMGGRADFFDADTNTAPPAGTRLFNTGLPPRGMCSTHQSMGSDACQPRNPNTNLPAMEPVWRYAMSAPVD